MADPLDVAFECVWVAHPGVPSFCQRNKMPQVHGFPLFVDRVPLNFVAVEVDLQFWKYSQNRAQAFPLFVGHNRLNFAAL